MSNNTEKLKNQLLEIAEVVNSFKSEAVQLRIIEKLLDTMAEEERLENGSYMIHSGKDSSRNQGINYKKKPGATKILYQLLSTEFFSQARTISAIAEYCQEQFHANFKTSELSGILLKLANENKLIRQRSNDNNRFEYVRA